MPEYEARPLAATRVVVAIEASDAVTSSMVSLVIPEKSLRGFTEDSVTCAAWIEVTVR